MRKLMLMLGFVPLDEHNRIVAETCDRCNAARGRLDEEINLAQGKRIRDLEAKVCGLTERTVVIHRARAITAELTEILQREA